MENKIVVITGGASGIGLAIVRELANKNTVISLDRNAAKIKALKAAFPGVVSILADVTSSGDLSNAIVTIEKVYGKIDILINNAGKGSNFDFVRMTEGSLMDHVEMEISVNYLTPIRLTKKALPLLQKSADPIVVIVSSGLAYVPMAFLGTYCASKAAVHFAAMSIRHQLEELNIRVVEVLPPVVDTDLSKHVRVDKMPADKFARIFLKKLSKGEDVMNIGQTAGLERFSRFMPKMAFKMLNRRRT